MKRSALLLSALVALGLGVSGTTAALAAPASPSPATEGSGTFYTKAQLPAKWAKAVAGIRASLPAGAAFPTSIPAMLADAPDNSRFQDGLPQELAARYWRCAWIDATLHPAPGVRTMARSTTENTIGRWSVMPGIKNNAGLEGYDKRISNYAATIGEDSLTAEFQSDCGPAVYVPTGQ